MSQKIAITGLGGTIGKRLIGQLPQDCHVYDLYNKAPAFTSGRENVFPVHLDLMNTEDISAVLDRIKPDVILHMAAKTHIDRCEEDRANGKEGVVWKTNVDSMHPIVEYVSNNPCHLIFLSTECVFDGKKSSYAENDKKNPLNWYGITKGAAEDMILDAKINASILRAVITFHEHDESRTLFGKILGQLEKRKPFTLVNDQRITPTYTDDIIKAILILMEKNNNGVFHVAPSQTTTPFVFGQEMAKSLGYDADLIKETSLEQFFGEAKAKLRVKNAVLDSAHSMPVLGFRARTINEVLHSIEQYIAV